MLELFNNAPMPDVGKINNLSLFIKRQQMTRILFMYELYKKVVPIHGSVMEFGVRWGQDMAMWECFRGMLEPYNYNRKIIGFDTFAGFPSVSEHDRASVGDLGVTAGYEYFLEQVLQKQEAESPIPIQKFRLVKGNVMDTLPAYLKTYPETLIAFAYFDLDLYEPTRFCLDAIEECLVRGSVIGFDELNNHNWPGETKAFLESLAYCHKLRRLPWAPTMSYIVWGE